jgi:uncharacterized membrane protein
MIVTQAMLAALYAALTLLVYPIAFGTLQFRVSEVLTILPFFNPMCAVGLGIGCFAANILGGYGPLDVVFGTLATVAAALWTARMRRDWLAPLPPVVLNAVVVGAVLAYSTAPGAFWVSFPIIAAQVGIGQIGACYVLGLPLIKLIRKYGATWRGVFAHGNKN